MCIYTISFFGHRVIEDPLLIEQRLETLIRKLLKEKEYVEFLVGRDGEFDQLPQSQSPQVLCGDIESIREKMIHTGRLQKRYTRYRQPCRR